MSDRPLPRCPHLRSCVEAFSSATERARSLAEGLSDQQANWRPGPGRWSVGECIEHLTLSAAVYLPGIEGAIERGRHRGLTGGAPYRTGPWGGRILLWGLRPRPGKGIRRLKTLKAFSPPSEILIAEALSRFADLNGRLIALAQRADGLQLDRIRLSSPVSPLIRLDLAQAFELHAIHEPRHLDQAERVKTAEGFPLA